MESSKDPASKYIIYKSHDEQCYGTEYDMGVINGKAGKAAALPKFSDMLTLSQPRETDYAHPLASLCLKFSVNTPKYEIWDGVGPVGSTESFGLGRKVCYF